MKKVRPVSAPTSDAGPAICPHCWMVNPGPFRLCARCGARMDTHLQESAGLKRTAPVQSPVPVSGGPRLSALQRVLVGAFLALLALTYVVQLVPMENRVGGSPATPAQAGGGGP